MLKLTNAQNTQRAKFPKRKMHEAQIAKCPNCKMLKLTNAQNTQRAKFPKRKTHQAQIAKCPN